MVMSLAVMVGNLSGKHAMGRSNLGGDDASNGAEFQAFSYKW